VGGIRLIKAVSDSFFKIPKLRIIFRIETLFLNKFLETLDKIQVGRVRWKVKQFDIEGFR
jgi:hypothetical protein